MAISSFPIVSEQWYEVKAGGKWEMCFLSHVYYEGYGTSNYYLSRDGRRKQEGYDYNHRGDENSFMKIARLPRKHFNMKILGEECDVSISPNGTGHEVTHPDFGEFVFSAKDANEYVKKHKEEIIEYYEGKLDEKINKRILNAILELQEVSNMANEYELSKESRMRIGAKLLSDMEPQLKRLCEGIPTIKNFLSYFKKKK